MKSNDLYIKKDNDVYQEGTFYPRLAAKLELTKALRPIKK